LKQLFIAIESKRSDLPYIGFSAPGSFGSSQDGLDSEKQLFHAEGLGEVVICTQREAFQYIFLHGFCSKKNDGNLLVHDSDLRSEGKTIFYGHHHIQQAEVIMELLEMAESFLTIGNPVSFIVLGL